MPHPFDDLAAPELAERYVPAAWLPSHAEICPLAPCWGHVVDDQFAFNPYGPDGTPGPVVFRPLDETLDRPPSILILELGLIDARYDEPVEKAAAAIEAQVRLLFDYCGGAVVRQRVWTVPELAALMARHQSAGQWTHIVLVGHGGVDGVAFVDHLDPVDGPPLQIGGHQLAELLGCFDGCGDCQIISLCCHSGCEEVVAELSKAPNVTEVLAPLHTFAVTWAPSFIGGYFLKLYEAGAGRQQALEQAATWCAETPMAIWRDGSQVHPL